MPLSSGSALGWLLTVSQSNGFSNEISAQDVEILGHSFADTMGQQCFEAMCLLVASREWFRFWRQRRYVFHINLRSDNNGALVAFSNLKGSSPGLNAIALEFALDTSENSFEPNAITHLPGITNKTADVLSRRLDPRYSKDCQVPLHLKHAKQVFPQNRSLQWWRAFKPPSVALTDGVLQSRFCLFSRSSRLLLIQFGPGSC